jgi:hypothetical protein
MTLMIVMIEVMMTKSMGSGGGGRKKKKQKKEKRKTATVVAQQDVDEETLLLRVEAEERARYGAFVGEGMTQPNGPVLHGPGVLGGLTSYELAHNPQYRRPGGLYSYYYSCNKS